MENTARFDDAAPGFWVADLAAARTFYEHLGFAPGYSNDGYAVLERDAMSLHIRHDATGDRAGNGFCTIFVSDIGTVFAECTRAGVRIARPLEDSSYGLRDFVVNDLDGNEILFGEATR